MSDLDSTNLVSTDPKIASLQAMFPTVEESILKEVLQAHGNNDERAVESLLAMTDESFVPEERPGEDVLRSQSDLDEDFARSLAFQDENDAAAHRQARSQHRGGGVGGGGVTDPSLLPYQPRVRRGAPPPASGQNYGYGADTQERGVQQSNQLAGPGIEEQFTKLAVEGKKAFTGFMSSGFMKSVQAKVASATGGPQNPPNQQSSSDYNYPVNPSSNQYSTSNPSQQYNSAPRTQNEDYPASVWTDGSFTPTSDASSINIYHPSPKTHNAPVPPTKDDRLSSPPPGSGSGKRSDEIRRDNTGGRQSPNMLGTSPPASNLSSSPSARIDFAKLGLLPKQKISLDGKPIATSPSSSPVPASAQPVKKVEPAAARKSEDNDDDDDDDALSYTANPFEDEDRR